MYNHPSDPSDKNPNTLDPDAPLPLPMPRKLLQVPGFLKEDLEQVAFREPDNFKAWCITAKHASSKADPEEPILVSRTHVETHHGKQLIFALLVFRNESGPCWEHGVFFGELAMSPDLYTELVREIGVRRPLPQKAPTPDQYDTTPIEREDEHWAKLLSSNGEYDDEDDDSEIPF